MNILQLESFSLTESAKFKNTLNPAVWDRHEHLKNAFKGQIRVGADEFRQHLGLKETQIKDVVVAGGMAGYLYKAGDAIDVVFIANINPDATFRELFMEHNYKFNHLHRYEVNGVKIQFFVHPSDEPFVTRGSYSVIHECWQQVAQRKPMEPNDTVALLRAAGYKNSPRVEVVRKKKVIRERKPVVYGYGQDYISEVGITPDGTSPTTAQFTNEDDAMSEEDILQDFIAFCASSLDLAELPQVKLRRDPQWCVVNKTFGRYNNQGKVLEVAWGQRHVMDVLRTVAHELTHALQHEREELPNTAGDTGSPFENEANARAGILMREYARLHPEFFNHGLQENKEYDPWSGIGFDVRSDELWPAKMFESTNPKESTDFNSWITNYKNNLIKPKKHSKCILAMANQTANHIIVFYGSAEYQGETKTNYILAIDSGVNQYSKNNQIVFASQDDFDKFKLVLTLKFSEYNIDIRNMAVRESKLKESSGYIPTAAQANDPRFEMALTADVRPGATGKNANKLLLNTDSQGHPQLMRADGVVQRMMEEYRRFKKNPICETTAISLTKLPKYHKGGVDELAKYVPERLTHRFALDPKKWESTFFSLTNKDPRKLKFYGPQQVEIAAGTLVGDMAIANQFYRATTPEEKEQFAQEYKDSVKPYTGDVSGYRFPELLIPK